MKEQNNIFGKQLDFNSERPKLSEKHCLQNSPGGVMVSVLSPWTIIHIVYTWSHMMDYYVGAE